MKAKRHPPNLSREDQTLQLQVGEVRKKYQGVHLRIGRQLPQTRKFSDELKEALLSGIASGERGSVDPSACRMSKELFDRKHPVIRDLMVAKRGVTDLFHNPRYTLTLPDSRSTRLVCVELLPEFSQLLDERIAAVRPAVQEFLRVLPELLAAQKERLGPLFFEADYDLPTDPERFYRISVEYREIEPPSYLLKIDPELYRRQEAQLQERLEEVVRQRERELLEGVFEVVDRLLARLRGDPEGPKTFRQSTVDRLYELIDQANADMRRLGLGQSEMGGVFRRLQNVIAGRSPEEMADLVRHDSVVQAAVADELQQIGEVVLSSATLAPRRRLLLDMATFRPFQRQQENCRE